MPNVQELEKTINKAREAYYNGQSIIDDDEFDALIAELGVLDPTNPILAEVGAEPSTTEWKKEKHLFPLGSLNKVNTPEEMTVWITEDLEGKPVVVSEKLDGLSIGCQYEDGKLVKAILRGGGETGENILVNVRKMKGAVKKLDAYWEDFSGVIRGEIVLLKDDHQKYFPTYSNPRNAASGLCRRLDGEGCQHLTLMMYDILTDNPEWVYEHEKFDFLEGNGFITPNWKSYTTTKEVNQMWQDYQDKTRDSLNYEIDGLVVACDDLMFQHSLGETNLRPKGKMAFKFANQFAKAIVKAITWETGSMGRINPRCWFEKTKLLGSEIEKASVYNLSYIESLGLGEGAEVLVCKAGEIIPRVEKVVKKATIVAKAPKKCPSCDHSLVMDGEYLVCRNTDKCPEQVIGRIKNWVKELNILEVGQKLIERLVSENLVENVSDLYTLTIDDLQSLDRMGKKSATKVHQELWKVNPIPLDVFVGGLSINLIGSSSIRLLISAGYDNIDKLMSLSVEKMMQVKGMGESRSQSLFDGLKKYQSVIDKLLKNGVKIMEKKEKVIGGKFDGKSFCFTGKMEHQRAELEEMVKNNGGEIKSVSRGLTYLVQAQSDSTSTKSEKAKKLGVQCIGELDFLEMLT
jgi:DNA ligase (NAD+)